MTSDEKQAFANEAEKALSHKLIEDVVDEALLNHNGNSERTGLLYYSLMKVAMYTATVARAQALGIDPDELRSTREESTKGMLRQARAFVAAGKPVLRVDESGVTRLD